MFTAILGDPPKSMAECSEGELEELARAAGVDSAALAAMSSEEKIEAINVRREAALRAAAILCGIRVEGSLLAAGFFAEALGMGAGTAAERPADRSFGLCSRPPARCCSQYVGRVGPMA